MKDTNSNSDRLQAAISDLRDEPVPQGPKAKTFEAMQAPNRRRGLVPALASSAIIIVAILVTAWPSQRAMAWQQVVKSTLNSTRFHRAEYKKDPRSGEWVHVGDFWLDGPKHALLYTYRKPLFDTSLKVDMRCDGKRVYGWRERGNFGEISDESLRDKKFDMSNAFSIETLLSSAYLKIGKTPTTGSLDGSEVLIYSGQQETGPRGKHVIESIRFFVRKDIGKIIRQETLDQKGEQTEYSTIDYSTAIPDDVFLPPKGVPIRDMDLQRAKLEQVLAHGVPFGKGNILRAVLEDNLGQLTVIWTGTPPNGDGSPYPILVGHVSHRVFGNDLMTTSIWKYGTHIGFPFQGQRLVGLSISLDKAVDGPITLQMPVLVENKKDPIRDPKGKILGYRSKQVGTCLIKDFPVHRDISMSALYMLRNGARK